MLAEGCQDAGADGLECNFSCPHMDRKDMGSNIGKDEGLCSVVTEAVKEVAKVPVWTQAHAGNAGHRRRGGGVFPRRRRRDRVVEHVPVAADDRSRDARVRDQRRRAGVERRARRPGDPADVAREHGADVPGVSRSRVFGNRRRIGLRSGAVVLPARAAARCRCAPPRCSIRRSVRT